MPGTPETILAFDFGLRRIGVAVGQQVTETASPLDTLANGEPGLGIELAEAVTAGVALALR